MHIASGSRATASSTFWLVATWAALDVAVAAYLQVNGVNAISTSFLALSVVAFGAAVLASARQASSVQGVLLLLVAAQTLLRVFLPFRQGPPSPEALFPLIALLASILVAIGGVLIRRTGTERAVRACLIGVAVLGLASRVGIVLVDIRPTFDVPLIQEAAATALRSGSDPYRTQNPSFCRAVADWLVERGAGAIHFSA